MTFASTKKKCVATSAFTEHQKSKENIQFNLSKSRGHQTICDGSIRQYARKKKEQLRSEVFTERVWVRAQIKFNVIDAQNRDGDYDEYNEAYFIVSLSVTLWAVMPRRRKSGAVIKMWTKSIR